MRIVILANGRSGSRSVFNFIGTHLKKINKKYIILHEPFNDSPKFMDDKHYINDIKFFEDKNNILIKTLMGEQYPRESFITWDEYIKWMFQYFDKIILLDRKDKIKQCESVFYHIKIDNRISLNYNWHTPKVYHLTEDDNEKIKTLVEHFEDTSKKMLEYSSLHNIPIFYYEDIFLEKNIKIILNLLNYLNINEIDQKIYNEWIDNKNKIVRIDKKINGLI